MIPPLSLKAGAMALMRRFPAITVTWDAQTGEAEIRKGARFRKTAELASLQEAALKLDKLSLREPPTQEERQAAVDTWTDAHS